MKTTKKPSKTKIFNFPSKNFNEFTLVQEPVTIDLKEVTGKKEKVDINLFHIADIQKARSLAERLLINIDNNGYQIPFKGFKGCQDDFLYFYHIMNFCLFGKESILTTRKIRPISGKQYNFRKLLLGTEKSETNLSNYTGYLEEDNDGINGAPLPEDDQYKNDLPDYQKDHDGSSLPGIGLPEDDYSDDNEPDDLSLGFQTIEPEDDKPEDNQTLTKPAQQKIFKYDKLYAKSRELLMKLLVFEHGDFASVRNTYFEIYGKEPSIANAFTAFRAGQYNFLENYFFILNLLFHYYHNRDSRSTYVTRSLKEAFDEHKYVDKHSKNDAFKQKFSELDSELRNLRAKIRSELIPEYFESSYPPFDNPRLKIKAYKYLKRILELEEELFSEDSYQIDSSKDAYKIIKDLSFEGCFHWFGYSYIKNNLKNDLSNIDKQTFLNLISWIDILVSGIKSYHRYSLFMSTTLFMKMLGAEFSLLYKQMEEKKIFKSDYDRKAFKIFWFTDGAKQEVKNTRIKDYFKEMPILGLNPRLAGYLLECESNSRMKKLALETMVLDIEKTQDGHDLTQEFINRANAFLLSIKRITETDAKKEEDFKDHVKGQKIKKEINELISLSHKGGYEFKKSEEEKEEKKDNKGKKDDNAYKKRDLDILNNKQTVDYENKFDLLFDPFINSLRQKQRTVFELLKKDKTYEKISEIMNEKYNQGTPQSVKKIAYSIMLPLSQYMTEKKIDESTLPPKIGRLFIKAKRKYIVLFLNFILAY